MPGRWCAVINTTLCLGAATAATTPTTATSTTLASALLVALPFSVSGRGIRPHRGSMPTLLLPVTFPVCPASRTLLSLHLLHFLMEQLQRTLGAHTDLDLAITVACMSVYVCVRVGDASATGRHRYRPTHQRVLPLAVLHIRKVHFVALQVCHTCGVSHPHPHWRIATELAWH